ncbi:hypothetical protein QFW96_07920 [Saccharopolyspora sp. TS4A08]|uniref:GATA-type domain-containing protein n=2 Tax=Saccharopolyspora TaxID=1835 RepID=A0ABT6PKK7_9PSEU|nr:hypothetical protein [Saccharopolyspora sp. TS4A08]MDI2028534.1 hypothetical protein [Saccharopolyspora sp. TS4A08]
MDDGAADAAGPADHRHHQLGDDQQREDVGHPHVDLHQPVVDAAAASAAHDHDAVVAAPDADPAVPDAPVADADVHDRAHDAGADALARPEREHDFPLMSLAVHACRSLCSWHRTPKELNGLPLLACRGCGSQWIRSEAWTPIDHTGRIPDDVRAELRER